MLTRRGIIAFRRMTLVAVFCLPFAPAAHAENLLQDLATPDAGDDSIIPDVKTRIAEDFKPIGGHIGSFYLYPEMQQLVETTSNVLAVPTGTQADAALHLLGRVRLVRPDPLNRIQLVAELGQTIHARAVDENRTTYLGRFFYRLGSAQRSNLALTTLGSHQFIARSDVNDIREARSPIEINTFDANAAYTWRSNRLSLIATGDFTRRNFFDARSRLGAFISQRYRDYNVVTFGEEGRYELVPGIEGVVRGNAGHYNYDLSPSDATFTPGVDLNRDSNIYRVEAGTRFNLAGQLYGAATAGYSWRNFGRGADVPRNSGGLSFAANLSWLVNPATTIVVNADRSFAESASRTISGYRSTGLTARLDQSVARGLIVSGSGRVRHLEPVGPGISRDEFGTSVEAQYYLTSRYSLSASIGYNGRRSNAINDEFDEAFLRFGVRWTL